MPNRLFDQIDLFAQQSPDRAALVIGQNRLNYGELKARSEKVACALQSFDFGRYSRVAILSRNLPEVIEIWHGAARAAHVFTPLNARLAAAEVVHIVNDSDARILVVDSMFHQLVEGIEDQLPGVEHIISLGQHARWHEYADWRDSYPQQASDCDVSECDTAVQMHTSGTTGFPKGVELSHRSFLACARAMMGLTAWSEGEVALVTAPLFHTAGSGYVQCALQSGGTAVLLKELTPEAVLSAIETHQVSDALLVPALIRMVLESPQCDTTNCSSLKRMLYGASPIPIPLLKRAIEVFGCEFEQGYGLTETVGPVAMLRPEDHDGGDKMKSCGKAVPGMDIRVVDSQGNDCGAGQVGEIVISGVQVMKGYWQRPEDTRKAIVDGWLHTGDAGFFDEDGYLYIHDRLKDMICTGGENVYPAEVESVLADCSGVADVAVIAVPDEQWGEAVKALIVPTADGAPEEQEIITFARQRIAGFKCPKSVDFIDAIPRNPSGKILKKILREPYWKGVERRVS